MAKYMRTALLWVITQRVVVNFTDVSEQPIGPVLRVQESKKPEDGTERLSRNVGKKLPLLAA